MEFLRRQLEEGELYDADVLRNALRTLRAGEDVKLSPGADLHLLIQAQ
ncbi:hypothetical protein [Actinomadura hibisca]|nr:hypothetical protein [Actinomadura hibisca]